VLLAGEEKLDEKATERLWSLLELDDPGAEVAIAPWDGRFNRSATDSVR
jgi:hypothetical protein